ncbi:MAG: nitrous oxide reductase family maturation protein NosD [Candidatus Hodarchaeota archaeon]
MHFSFPKYLILSVLLSFFIGMGIGVTSDQVTPTISSFSQVALSNDPHVMMGFIQSTPPIVIGGNNDFKSYGFPGNGSEFNPYVIENKRIISEASHLIEIEDTTAYFIIRNCTLNGLETSSMGISLDNVTYATITNNTIFDIHDDGIEAGNCSFNTIHGNTIFNCGGIAIHIYGYIHSSTSGGITTRVHCVSLYNNISDNVIYSCLGGISFGSAGYTIIENNTIFNGAYGDYLGEKYHGITILGDDEGDIYKDEFPAGNHLIQNNLISKFGRGIHIQESIDNLILNNTIHGNDDIGISTSDKSENILIKWNDFIYNNPSMPKPIKPQASGRGVNITFTHNFWDEGRLPDNDQDGFADVPYSIYGDNYDNNPLTQYNNPQTLTFDIITRPIILSPNASKSVRGSTNILWASAIDYKGHSFTYDLYYSTDWGESWTEIVTGISDTNYEWKAPDVSTGCRIKVIATCAQGVSVDAFSEELRLKSAIPGWTFLTIFSVLCLGVVLSKIKRKST